MSDKITDMIDMDAIAHLADLVAQKDLGEITITDGSKTITVKGKKSLPPMPVGMPAVPAAAAPAAAAPSGRRPPYPRRIPPPHRPRPPPGRRLPLSPRR